MLALVIAWKFSIVFFLIAPFNIFTGKIFYIVIINSMIIFKVILLKGATMVKMIKKYTSEEFKAYGKAGSISQEALSSIRTVLSFGIHNRLIKMYAEKLKLLLQL